METVDYPGNTVPAAHLPAEVCTGLTLFQIEETIALLAESAEEEGLTPEIEQALATYLQGALEKRDRVAEFILYCEGMAALAKAEVQRLQTRQKHFECTAERIRAMALRVLDCLGVSKLEGRTHTLKKRKCPASVAVRDQAEISAEFKRVTVILPASRWEALLAALPKEVSEQVRGEIIKQETGIEVAAIKEALKSGASVPGAELVGDRYSLQIQ
jgi:hypothetical protein